ncbi:hypothetical protein Goarm_002341 [Gossypium armourianum]|uniref:UspA domain-containing protein n=1 Tax=Gossypium armourianum TaxID=34283 RepID=A0A7J9K7Z1_9ROSI|nr:hypothetical protein [Gossypium armourianum]
MTEVGDPKEKICEAVEKLNIELLILGSHGRGAIQRAFLGSVSNHCVHNAKCPVLVAITLKVTTTEFHFVGQTIAFGDELGENVRKLGLFENQ